MPAIQTYTSIHTYLPVVRPKEVFIGPVYAPLTLMQFGDYDSDMSLHYGSIVKEILRAYPYLIRFNFRHYPGTDPHGNGFKAAEAAIAAAQTARFAEMHELLLRNRNKLDGVSLTYYARSLDMDKLDFLDAICSGRYGAYVREDCLTAIAMGVSPGRCFFLNGERIAGPVSAKRIREKIETKLNTR